MNTQSSQPGVVMLDLAGSEVSAEEREMLQRPVVGGLILFSRNYQSPHQLRELIADIRQCRADILIAVDQEGGRVQRFREGFLELPPLHALGQLYRRDKPRGLLAAKHCAWAMAAEVLHFGIDISFAPVLDLYNPAAQVIGERAFAADVHDVIALATAYIDGMREAGMAVTGKHYPGHGTVIADSHLQLPKDERGAGEILENDYRVFAACIDALDGIMPAHVVYPAIDDCPAGYSTVWIQDKLRRELGFDGVVFSDDLSMVAAHSAGKAEQRAALALEAGCDMVLVCNDRAAALAVCDWVERQAPGGPAGITRMRATPAAEIENLYHETKWVQARAAVESLRTQ